MQQNFHLATVTLTSEKDTEDFAKHIAKHAIIGDVILLKGTLGMGKSSFARSFIRSLANTPDMDVPSPTFTLVQTYETLQKPVWHFDLYRLESPEEVYETGLEEALISGISLIEWPERLGTISFRNALLIEIKKGDSTTTRKVTVSSSNQDQDTKWAPVLEDFSTMRDFKESQL